MSLTTSRPRACSVGSARRQRYAFGAAALGVSGAYAAASLAGALPKVLLAGVFVPLALGLELLLRANRSLCVRLAYPDRRDVAADCSGPCAAATSDRPEDRIRAVRVTAAAVAAAAGTTLALVIAA